MVVIPHQANEKIVKLVLNAVLLLFDEQNLMLGHIYSWIIELAVVNETQDDQVLESGLEVRPSSKQERREIYGGTWGGINNYSLNDKKSGVNEFTNR